MSIAQDVAEWINARPDGAISADVAKQFSMTVSRASVLLSQIHREKRFTTRVEHLCLRNDNGKGRHTRRLFVDLVQAPQWHKTPVIGENEDKSQVVRFDSVTDADRIGGFCRHSITLCLNGTQDKHGGYRWIRDVKGVSFD